MMNFNWGGTAVPNATQKRRTISTTNTAGGKASLRCIKCWSILLAGLFCLKAISFAQLKSDNKSTNEIANIKPLQIGDSIPEALWHMPLAVINHPEGKETITLDDYRGKKLIILDFWAPYCKPCIKSIFKLDSIERELGEDMAVLPFLVYSREENAVEFIEKHGWQQLSVVNDTLWNKLFLRRYLTGFGNAWIKDGRLLAVPIPNNLTFKNVRSVLDGDIPIFDNVKQLF